MNRKKYMNAILAVAHEYFDGATLETHPTHMKLCMDGYTLTVSGTPKVADMVLKEVRRDIKRYISGHYKVRAR